MLMLGFAGFLFFRLELLGQQVGKNQAGNQCFVLFTAPKMVEDAAPAQQDMPDAAEYEGVATGGQQVVQAEVHGEAEDYLLENEDNEDDEDNDDEDEEEKDDEEEDKEDPEWEAEVTRQQEIRLIKIKVCFTSSRVICGAASG